MKCLAQGHNVIFHGRESNRQPSDYQPDSLTAEPPDSPNAFSVSPSTSVCVCHTYRGPGGGLPDVVELPVEGSHRVTFALDDLTLTPPIKLGLSLHTLGLHDLETKRAQRSTPIPSVCDQAA